MVFFSRNSLPRIKDETHVINLNDKKYIDRNAAVYFDSFGIEYISQEVLNKIKDKSITLNIFRIQDNDFFMCGLYCIAFIEFMLSGKSLLDYTNLFFLNNYKKNEKLIYISILRRNMSTLEFRL